MPVDDLLSGIVERTRELLSTEFQISYPKTVPEVTEVGFKEARSIDGVCLFVDMRGSTGITAEKHRETAVRIYRACLDNIAEVIHHDTGEIRGVAGDSFLALFSGPENNADKAVRCAWMIQSVIHHIVAPEVRKRFDLELSVGVGIDMGTILAARVGKPYVPTTQNLIWASHAVNSAAKLCAAASPAEVVVSERVWSAMTRATKISGKGKPLGWQERFAAIAGEAVKVYAERGVYLTSLETAGLYTTIPLPQAKVSPLLDPQEIHELRHALKQYGPAAFEMRIAELTAQLANAKNTLDRLLLIERILECYQLLGRVDDLKTWPARKLAFERVRIFQLNNCSVLAKEGLREILQRFRWGDPEELVSVFRQEGMLSDLIDAVEADSWKTEHDYWLLHRAFSARAGVGDSRRADDARTEALKKGASYIGVAIQDLRTKAEQTKPPTVIDFMNQLLTGSTKAG